MGSNVKTVYRKTGTGKGLKSHKKVSAAARALIKRAREEKRGVPRAKKS